MMFRSVLKEPYDQLPQASKKILQSNNVYLNYEKYLDQLVSDCIKMIESVENFSIIINENYLKDLSVENVIKLEKRLDNEYTKAQKEYKYITDIFSYDKAAIFIYSYNKDFENQYKTMKNNFENLSKINFSKKSVINSYDFSIKKNRKYFYSIDNWNKRLAVFSAETYVEETVVSFNYPINMHKFACFIPIKKHKIFCCCVPMNQSQNTACIINVNKMSIKELASTNIRWNSGGIYYKNQIYIFGGENQSGDLKLAEKYDMDSKSWRKLTPLPLSSSLCTCCFFNSKILISGRVYKVYSYDIMADSYSEILKICSSGIISTWNKRAYVFEIYGSIYESEIGDEYKWKKIGKNIISGNLVYKFYYNGNFYIKTRESCGGSFYKFDLENKNLIKLGEYS